MAQNNHSGREQYFQTLNAYQTACKQSHIFANDVQDPLDLKESGLERTVFDVTTLNHRELPDGSMVPDGIPHTASKEQGDEKESQTIDADYWRSLGVKDGEGAPDIWTGRTKAVDSRWPGIQSSSNAGLQFGDGSFNDTEHIVRENANVFKERDSWSTKKIERDDEEMSNQLRAFREQPAPAFEDEEQVQNFRLENYGACVPDQTMPGIQQYTLGISERDIQRDLNTQRFKESEGSDLGKMSYASYGV
jgi:hypothetical protein